MHGPRLRPAQEGALHWRILLLGRQQFFEEPTRSGVTWRAVEALLLALGAELIERRGSRVRVALNGVRAVLHRPHPNKELSRAMVRSLREFLANAGVR